MLNADFATTVLIAFSAVIGFTTPLQVAVMAVCEIAIFASKEYLETEIMMVIVFGRVSTKYRRILFYIAFCLLS